MTLRSIAVLEPGYAAYETERSVLSTHDVSVVPVSADEDAIEALQVIDPAAILVRERTVNAAVIDACSNLRTVVRYGVGFDNIDIEHARSRKIFVANVPDYGAEKEVSEHALSLYLAIQRRILSRDAEVRRGEWGIGQRGLIPDRENAALGLIGCGKIGSSTARKFRAIGFGKIIVADPYLADEAAEDMGVEKVDLATLCRLADVVSLHAPLTTETRHILDAEHIALMKPTSVVLNVSRGGLLDEQALASALHEGRIFGAGIDVFENEPVSLDNPLLATPNTIVSDHVAWYSERSVVKLQRCAAREVQRVLENRQPRHWVNPW